MGFERRHAARPGAEARRRAGLRVIESRARQNAPVRSRWGFKSWSLRKRSKVIRSLLLRKLGHWRGGGPAGRCRALAERSARWSRSEARPPISRWIEARGVLYIANFTANRIDVMSLANNTIQTSINVAPQPSSISLSPDGHWLLVAHYGNNTAPAQPTNALTLIDLTANNAKQTFALGDPPLGVAFGLDNKALVVTTQEFILFDPDGRDHQVLETDRAGGDARPSRNRRRPFRANFTQASVAVSHDGLTIAGIRRNQSVICCSATTSRTTAITLAPSILASPPAGPRVVSLSRRRQPGHLRLVGCRTRIWSATAQFAQCFRTFKRRQHRRSIRRAT